MNKLKQTRGILRIEAELLPDGVSYSERGLLRSFTTKVPFENISDDLTRAFHVSRIYLFISLFFVLAFGYRFYGFLTTDGVSTGSLIWSAFLAFIAAGGTWMQSARFVGYLASGSNLLFFEKKGAQEPYAFLEAIQDAKLAYLRRRYADTSALEEIHSSGSHTSGPVH